MPKVAVNLADLTTLHGKSGFPLQILLSDYCNSSSPLVEAERGMVDGYAVVLDGPATGDIGRLKAFVDLIIGMGQRRMHRPTRVYLQGPKGGWRRIKSGEEVK